jgi:hypothetical protein
MKRKLKVVKWLVQQLGCSMSWRRSRRPCIEVYLAAPRTLPGHLWQRRVRDTNGQITYDSGQRESKANAIRTARAQAKRWGWQAAIVEEVRA